MSSSEDTTLTPDEAVTLHHAIIDTNRRCVELEDQLKQAQGAADEYKALLDQAMQENHALRTRLTAVALVIRP